jgi:hypothetical protein
VGSLTVGNARLATIVGIVKAISSLHRELFFPLRAAD